MKCGPGLRRVLDLLYRGKALVSLSEKLDTKSAVGEFLFTLMVSLAQMERKLIRERTAAALQSKKSRSEQVGKIPFGYELAVDGVHLEPEPNEQTVISLISRLKGKGLSCRRIAKDLNQRSYCTKKGGAWTHVQVSRLLRQAS